MASDPSYVVLWSRKAKESLIAYGKQKRELDSIAAVAQAAMALHRKLRRNPLEVGEPYRIKGVIEERLAVKECLAIDFAIDKANQLVLVRDCRVMSGPGI
jgi:hypothetical protein